MERKQWIIFQEEANGIIFIVNISLIYKTQEMHINNDESKLNVEVAQI